MRVTSKFIALAALLFCLAPAQAQNNPSGSVPVNPWQDYSTSVAPANTKQRTQNVPLAAAQQRTQSAPLAAAQQRTQNAAVAAAKQSPSSAPPAPSNKNTLPATATSCVDLSVAVVYPPPPPPPEDSSSGTNSTANLPPAPAPGYQPIFQHGVFVGYMSPDLISLMQTDPTDAWTQFANSSDFVGPEGLRLSLLAETGAASPDQMAALEQMALFGM